MLLTAALLVALLLAPSLAFVDSQCSDSDMNCPVWAALNSSDCETSSLLKKHCLKTCRVCGQPVPDKYDVMRLPPELAPVAFLVGRWRSEFGGKAFFPTIPRFTYGEQLDISFASENMRPPFVLNYTAFAWDPNDETELHQENGFIAVNHTDGVPRACLTTAMSNGFMAVEEGVVKENQIRFELRRIGRISFSHDSAVRLMYREWTLLDERRLDSRLRMATPITRKLMEHTRITYKKIFP